MSLSDILEIWKGHISFFTIIPCSSRKSIYDILKYVDLVVLTVSPIICAICCLPILILYLLNISLNMYIVSTLSYSIMLVLTGMLHIDGLTDVVDALFAPRERRFEVLKDPRIGAVGASALFIILSLGLISMIISRNLIEIITKILLSEYYSRLSCSICARMGRPIHEGLGSIVYKGVRRYRQLILIPISVNTLLSILLLGPIKATIYLTSTTVITLILISIPIKALGGISGDVLGYSIEIGRHISLLVLSCIV